METVCIVDDYDINVFILEEYLKNSYVIQSFSNAKDCIDFVKRNKVHFILMDCNMPVIDGYMATKIIKLDNPGAKVIGVTASSFEEDIKKCYESGMDSVLTKPIFKEKLLETIKIFHG